MTQIHIVVRRINPALNIDLAQVGYIKDGQFVQLPHDIFLGTPIFDYFLTSEISQSPYIEHQSIADLVTVLAPYSNFVVEFFDNTIILMFDFNVDYDESTTEEKRKRH